MKEKLITQYQQLILQLENHPSITVVKKNDDLVEIHPKTIELFQKRIKQKLPGGLPAELLEYVDVSNIFQLYWTYDAGNKQQGGSEFKLVSLLEVFLLEKQPAWSPVLTREEIALLDQFKVFDEQGLSGSGRVTGFVKGEYNKLVIYFYDKAFYKTNLDYGSYIEEMLNLKGIGGWQYFFSDFSQSSDRNYLVQYLNERLSHLKILFPSEDFSKYESLVPKL